MKFSIRDIMLVTVIVALAVMWCVDRIRLANVEADRAAFEADRAVFENDARYLSKLASNLEDPFIDAKSKELYRKYNPLPYPSASAPKPAKP
jgi:hypothetical protein